jgi:hypothetical protein
MAAYRAFADDSPPPYAEGDSESYTLGVEFHVTAACTLTQIHFWQPETGGTSDTRTVGAWSSSEWGTGDLLTSQDYTPAGTGWQTITLTTPVSLAPGTTYVAGVQFPNGGYAATSYYFDGGQDVVNGPLVIPAIVNTAFGHQGLFTGSTGFNIPDDSFNSSNYWIDVTVEDSNPQPTLSPGVTVYDGTKWVNGEVKVWDGTQWE